MKIKISALKKLILLMFCSFFIITFKVHATADKNNIQECLTQVSQLVEIQTAPEQTLPIFIFEKVAGRWALIGNTHRSSTTPTVTDITTSTFKKITAKNSVSSQKMTIDFSESNQQQTLEKFGAKHVGQVVFSEQKFKVESVSPQATENILKQGDIIEFTDKNPTQIYYVNNFTQGGGGSFHNELILDGKRVVLTQLKKPASNSTKYDVKKEVIFEVSGAMGRTLPNYKIISRGNTLSRQISERTLPLRILVITGHRMVC